MTGFARPCLICGKRVEGGEPRCADHANQRYSAPLGCYVCGRRGPRGYCEEHDPWANEEGRDDRQPWRAGYRSPKYRKNRKLALERSRGACERCGRSDLPLEVDHLTPLRTGRTPEEIDALNELANLVVLCVTCHRFKSRRQR